LICGSELLSPLLRAAVSLELFMNAQYYVKHPFLQDKLLVEDIHLSENTQFLMSISENATKDSGTGDKGRKLSVIKEAILNSIDRTWTSLICMLGLSSVVGVSIKSLYPRSQGYEKIIGGIIKPRCQNFNISTNDLSIMWTNSGIINTPECKFAPNHFVPIVLGPLELESPSKKAKLDDSKLGNFE
jgi:hypothetical protein